MLPDIRALELEIVDYLSGVTRCEVQRRQLLGGTEHNFFMLDTYFGMFGRYRKIASMGVSDDGAVAAKSYDRRAHVETMEAIGREAVMFGYVGQQISDEYIRQQMEKVTSSYP